MRSWKRRLTRLLIGGSDVGRVGYQRAFRGLRERNRTELYIGLGLTALAWLRRTGPRKRLLYRRNLPEGSALVVHNRRPGSPRIEVLKPGNRL